MKGNKMKRKENNHLAEGEATGHFHKAVGNEVEVFEEAYGDNSLHLNIPNGGTVIHQEHGIVEIPAGTHRTGKVLEYDPAEEEVKEVQD